MSASSAVVMGSFVRIFARAAAPPPAFRASKAEGRKENPLYGLGIARLAEGKRSSGAPLPAGLATIFGPKSEFSGRKAAISARKRLAADALSEPRSGRSRRRAPVRSRPAFRTAFAAVSIVLDHRSARHGACRSSHQAVLPLGRGPPPILVINSFLRGSHERALPQLRISEPRPQSASPDGAPICVHRARLDRERRDG